MLSLKFLLPVIINLSAFVNASPTPQSVSLTQPNPPDDTGLFICRDVDWQVCEHIVSKWGTSISESICQQLDGQASAAGPDPGLECVLYGSIDCSGTDSIKLRFPGNNWLGSINVGAVNWNDHAKSFQCYWTNGQIPSEASSVSLNSIITALYNFIAKIAAQSSESVAASDNANAFVASVTAHSSVAGIYEPPMDVDKE